MFSSEQLDKMACLIRFGHSSPTKGHETGKFWRNGEIIDVVEEMKLVGYMIRSDLKTILNTKIHS